MADFVATVTRKTAPLPVGSRIAILGGGQLGRMLAMAAARLGFETSVYSDGEENPAFEVSGTAVHGDYNDLAALERFVADADVLTYEFENVPVAAAEALARLLPVRPGPKALEVAQDRLVEKQFIQSCGLPVAPFAVVDDVEGLQRAVANLGPDAILKTRRLGYDGKGQVSLKPGADLAGALAAVGHAPCVLEKRVAFTAELSVIAVRGVAGDMRTYDVPRNVHSSGILHTSTVPSGLPAEVEADAKAMAQRLCAALDYVGVIGVEFFYLGADRENPLTINEFAPRVHNSGHWTMDACNTDQFENHIRAIAGWPLGGTERTTDVEMTNLIGSDVNAALSIAGEAGSILHLYGKRDGRPGRKMGHVNRVRR